MAGLNKVMIIGNLGADPEMRYTADGNALTSFRVAANRTFTTPDGERRDETEWFSVVAWRKLAEQCSQFLQKGRRVYLEAACARAPGMPQTVRSAIARKLSRIGSYSWTGRAARLCRRIRRGWKRPSLCGPRRPRRYLSSRSVWRERSSGRRRIPRPAKISAAKPLPPRSRGPLLSGGPLRGSGKGGTVRTSALTEVADADVSA